MSIPFRGSVLAVVVAILLTVLVSLVPPSGITPPPAVHADTARTASSAVVTAVIDGDTIRVAQAGTVATVRLIGIDTPEVKDPRKPVQCYGREASARTTALLLGVTVTLVDDPSQGNLDKYGRWLRYVVLADGTDVNLALIRDGYAFEYTYAVPYRYQTAYKAAQRDARAAQVGLWSPDTCNGVVTTPAPTATRTRTRTATRTTTAVPTRTPTVAGGSSEASFPCQVGQIKGNTASMIYHVPGGAYYARTRASVVCFWTEAAAVAAGYRRSLRWSPAP